MRALITTGMVLLTAPSFAAPGTAAVAQAVTQHMAVAALHVDHQAQGAGRTPAELPAVATAAQGAAAAPPATRPHTQVSGESERADMAMMGIVALVMVATFVFKGRQG